jgi:hypothetical protein
LQLGNVTLNQMSPAPSGLSLNGTYGFTNFVDTSGAGGTGSVSSDHSISFSSDGTFTMTNFIGLVNAGDNGNTATSRQSNGSGTYHFDGYTVQLTFANSTTEQHVFFIIPDKGSTSAIAIDGTPYLKQSWFPHRERVGCGLKLSHRYCRCSCLATYQIVAPPSTTIVWPVI